MDKGTDPEVQEHCPEIRWHFIGNCQTNKVPKLARCPNLSSVETVTSAKLADKLQAQFKRSDGEKERLKVMIQVNTSGEENKNGVDPPSAPLLARHIASSCPDLDLVGVMTIGALGHSLESAARMAAEAEAKGGQNPDFLGLIEAR